MLTFKHIWNRLYNSTLQACIIVWIEHEFAFHFQFEDHKNVIIVLLEKNDLSCSLALQLHGYTSAASCNHLAPSLSRSDFTGGIWPMKSELTHTVATNWNETDSSQEIKQFSEALYFVQLNVEWLIDLRVSGQLTLCALEMTLWPAAQSTYQFIWSTMINDQSIPMSSKCNRC